MDSHLLILVTGIRPGNGPKSMSDTLALPSAMYFEIKQTAFTFFKRIAFAVCTPNLNEASSQERWMRNVVGLAMAPLLYARQFRQDICHV